MTHYLVTYDRKRGKTVSLEPFDVPARALAAYSTAEREAFLKGDRYEVVLFGADTEDQLARSHPRYFEPAELSEV